MQRNRHVLKLVALVVAFAIVTPHVHAQTTLRLLSGFTSNNSNVPSIEAPFIKNVEAASKGQIKIQRSGPEVASPFEQLQPVSSGVFDILYTAPGYHIAQTGVGLLLDALKPEPEERRARGFIQKADEHYRRQHGVTLIAVVPLTGNHFVLKEGLSSDGTLKGLKLRSNATFEGVIRALGGIPVNMGAAEAYSSMQKGVLDGITFPAFASTDYKLQEIGKVMTRPLFGGTNVAFFVNVRRFESLRPDQQKILLEEGRKIEAMGKAAMEHVTEKDEAKMKDSGVKVVSFGAKMAPKLNALFNEGIRATASKSSAKDVAELWDLAKAKNLLNQ